MYALFYDCLSLCLLPDISKWNNYNENDINETVIYDLFNRLEDTNVNSIYSSTPLKDSEILNDINLIQHLQKEKFYRLYD